MATDQISDFLKEDINLENIVLSSKKSVVKASGVRAYTNWGFYHNTYGNYGNYSNYSNHYNYTQNYTNGTYDPGHVEYGAYDAYGATYTKYSVSYDNYSNYSNYCQVNCQVCNTCQSKCQVNQYVSYWLGKTFNYNPDLLYILTNDINDLIDYINNAKDYINTNLNKYSISNNRISLDVSGNKVSLSDVYYHTTFNAVNNAIKEFINGETNINNKNRSDDILKSNMETLKASLNRIQIPATIPCCQTSGHETCITRQD